MPEPGYAGSNAATQGKQFTAMDLIVVLKPRRQLFPQTAKAHAGTLSSASGTGGRTSSSGSTSTPTRPCSMPALASAENNT